MKLSTEQQQMILDNNKLVHFIVQKLGIFPNSIDYEDIVSIGTIGLIKACITFDSSKNNAFSTYASKCITNEIFYHFRKTKKYANDISIDNPIGSDADGNEFTLGETIKHSNSNFVENIANRDILIQLISIILNYLKGKNKIVMLYRMGNISQANIARILNFSRSYVSKIQENAISKIQKVINQKIYYEEIFSVDITDEFYKISFSLKDICKFNNIFSNKLQNTIVTGLTNFKISSNKDQILIQLPADPYFFSFLAQIIQEIDNFRIEFDDDKNKIEEKIIRHTSQTQIIMEYILTLDTFSVNQIISQFSNIPAVIVTSVIWISELKGLIKSTTVDKYVVNKNQCC